MVTQGESAAESRRREQGLWWAGAAGVVLLVLAAVLIPASLWMLRRSRSLFAENGLPVVLVIGTVLLLLSLGLLAIVFKYLGLADSRFALGLPEGSIRAVIALALILLFFIASIFLVSFTRGESTRTFENVPEALLDKISVDRIVGFELVEGSDPPAYDVVVRRLDRAVSDDLAKQLLTTVSTLVVAVAAFYFGANSVQTARGDEGRGERTTSNGPEQPSPAEPGPAVDPEHPKTDTESEEPPTPPPRAPFTLPASGT